MKPMLAAFAACLIITVAAPWVLVTLGLGHDPARSAGGAVRLDQGR